MNSPGVIERGPQVPSDPNLDVLPGAAAVLDADLRLLRANAQFLDLCRAPAPGAPLEALLNLGAAPPLGARATLRARSATGAKLEVNLARHAGEVGVLARAVPCAVPCASAPELARAGDALLALSRELILAGSNDLLVSAIARCMREIFPAAHFCVRIVEPNSGAPQAVLAEGPLRDDCGAALALRRGAAEKAQVDLHFGAGEHVVLTDDEPRIFKGTVGGFATPLVASGQFFGVINLEFPAGVATDLQRDEKLLIQLANQAAVGIRNARLIDELTVVKRQLEELIENANALILVLDRDRSIRVFNRALENLTGYRREEVLGRDVLDFVVLDRRDEAIAFVEKSLRTEPHNIGEVAVRLANGQQLRVSLATAAVAGPYGDLDALIVIGQDLTRQREFERRVVQAEKLASLGQLAAGVVHEINNPLTTISMYAESLLQLAPLRHADASDVDKLRRIQESAERILKFARELTSYAKPTQDRAQVLDVHHIVDQAAQYCEHAFKQSRATLTREYAQGLPALHGVRSNLVQVFVNLLTNACHALPESGGAITVSTRPTSNGAVEIEVADTGTGIEAAALPHIFEPFFTTKAEGRGTGLGLTVVQGIVEKHGGKIEVRSQVGQGTAFTVRLPAAAPS